MSDPAYILVVDDDEGLRALLEAMLTENKYKVKTVASAFQARGALARTRPDLVILDRDLPDVEGVDFIKEIHGLPNMARLPVLFLTGRDRVSEKLQGLRAGGDDYLTKPFNKNELLARLEALLRRSSLPPEPAHVLRGKGIELDLDRHAVEIEGRPVPLSPKEFALLTAFMEKRGRVLSRLFLLERVWGPNMDLHLNQKTVDVSVGRLRAALGEFGARIVAVQSSGYRLDLD